VQLFSPDEAVSDLSDRVVSVTKMTATEASRNFSALLNRVAAGERIEITRAGAVVAVLEPPRPQLMTWREFKQLLEGMPPLDDQFGADLRAIREANNQPMPEHEWPS
jgi:prevent-host-death family protein